MVVIKRNVASHQKSNYFQTFCRGENMSKRLFLLSFIVDVIPIECNVFRDTLYIVNFNQVNTNNIFLEALIFI